MAPRWVFAKLGWHYEHYRSITVRVSGSSSTVTEGYARAHLVDTIASRIFYAAGGNSFDFELRYDTPWRPTCIVIANHNLTSASSVHTLSLAGSTDGVTWSGDVASLTATDAWPADGTTIFTLAGHGATQYAYWRVSIADSALTMPHIFGEVALGFSYTPVEGSKAMLPIIRPQIYSRPLAGGVTAAGAMLTVPIIGSAEIWPLDWDGVTIAVADELRALGLQARNGLYPIAAHSPRQTDSDDPSGSLNVDAVLDAHFFRSSPVRSTDRDAYRENVTMDLTREAPTWPIERA